jgi:2-iminobutanoate/2-iminopropanoate deaminase
MSTVKVSLLCSMKQQITTTHAPWPIGPFSQAITAGNLVFVSAQFSRNTATGEMVNHSIEAETTQVMENLKAILREAGTDLNHVVKASIFLRDMHDYATVNEVYGGYFTEPYPARETIQVGALPMFVNIEISVIAILLQ